jgi:hypothetical protein
VIDPVSLTFVEGPCDGLDDLASTFEVAADRFLDDDAREGMLRVKACSSLGSLMSPADMR